MSQEDGAASRKPDKQQAAFVWKVMAEAGTKSMLPEHPSGTHLEDSSFIKIWFCGFVILFYFFFAFLFYFFSLRQRNRVLRT